MMEVVTCVVQDHDLRLVAGAIIVCLVGSVATVQLFGRMRASGGSSRAAWILLSAIATGTMVWCTHFVETLAFKSGVPVTLDPVLTLASIAIAIILAAGPLDPGALGRRLQHRATALLAGLRHTGGVRRQTRTATGEVNPARCFTCAYARQHRPVPSCRWMKDGGQVTRTTDEIATIAA